MHAILAARELAAPETRLTGQHPRADSLRVRARPLLHRQRSAGRRHRPRKYPPRPRRRGISHAARRARSDDPTAISRRADKPFCVVATLGTTSSASVDPLPAIAAIAERHGLWLHVDAAYGGPAALLEEHRHILDGSARADSMVVNPHKWLFTPVDLSILYTRRPDIMRRALRSTKRPRICSQPSMSAR